MAMTMHVDVVSAEALIFSGNAEFFTAPAEGGEVGIYPRHAPLLTRIRLAPYASSWQTRTNRMSSCTFRAVCLKYNRTGLPFWLTRPFVVRTSTKPRPAKPKPRQKKP